MIQNKKDNSCKNYPFFMLADLDSNQERLHQKQ